MKIGYSSLVCPGWDMESIVRNAADWGFEGVELRGILGQLHLPLVPELAGRPDRTRDFFHEHNVELVCLGASATLDYKDQREIARKKELVGEFIELASQLGCPYVRMFVGEIQRFDNHNAALSRICEALKGLTAAASKYDVTILLENGGDFPGSEDLWFLIDSLDHPLIRACWNQCHAMTIGERATNSIPRLGNKIGLIHLCDAAFDEQGTLLAYKPLGEGDGEIAKQVELLRGLTYDRYLMFEWPKMWVDSLPEPEAVLPGTAAFLRQCLDSKHPVLSAYKGDKQAPRWASRVPSAD